MHWKRSFGIVSICLFTLAAGLAVLAWQPEHTKATQPRAALTQVPDGPPDPTPAHARTWMTIENHPENFSVTLPGNWITINLDPETYHAAMKKLTENNPSMAKVFSDKMANMMAKGIKLYAMELDPSNPGQPSKTCNVFVEDMPYAMSLKVFAQEVMAGANKVINGQVVSQPHVIQSAAGEGMSYTLKARIKRRGRKEVTVTSTQACFIFNQKAYVLTVAVPEAPSKVQSDLCGRILRSFTLLDGRKQSYPPVKDWKEFAISNAGVKLRLPEKPDITRTLNRPIRLNGSPFLARTMVYTCTSRNIRIAVLVTFYAKGDASDMEDAFIHGAGRTWVMSAFGDLLGADSISEPKHYKEKTSDAKDGDWGQKTWDAELSAGDTLLHMKGSLLAVDNTLYTVAVYYKEPDDEVAKAADAILDSATLAMPSVVESNGGDLDRAFSKSMLSKPWARASLADTDLSLTLPPSSHLLQAPIEKIHSPESKNVIWRRYTAQDPGIAIDVEVISAKDKDFQSLEAFAKERALLQTSLAKQGVARSEMTATAEGDHAVRLEAVIRQGPYPTHLSVLLRADGRTVYTVGAVYREDDANAAEAAQRMIRSVKIRN